MLVSDPAVTASQFILTQSIDAVPMTGNELLRNYDREK